jgi:hypothetical protein
MAAIDTHATREQLLEAVLCAVRADAIKRGLAAIRRESCDGSETSRRLV